MSFVEASLVLAGRDEDQTAWHGLDALIAGVGIQVVAHDAVLTAALNFGDCASYALAMTRG